MLLIWFGLRLRHGFGYGFGYGFGMVLMWFGNGAPFQGAPWVGFKKGNRNSLGTGFWLMFRFFGGGLAMI